MRVKLLQAFLNPTQPEHPEINAKSYKKQQGHKHRQKNSLYYHISTKNTVLGSILEPPGLPKWLPKWVLRYKIRD